VRWARAVAEFHRLSFYTRYRCWCADRQSEPVDAVKFGRQLDALRSEGVLRARRQGADVLCVDVKLIA